jgi:hypothetical protein
MGVFCILVSVDKYMSKLTVGSVKMGWRVIYFLLGGHGLFGKYVNFPYY